MILCDSCKNFDGCALAWHGKVHQPGDHCTGLVLITRADLAARDAEIARLREVREALISAMRGRMGAANAFHLTRRLGDALDASHNSPVVRATEGTSHDA